MSNKRKAEDPIPSQISEADADSSSGEEIDLSETSSGEEDDNDSSSDKEINSSEPSTTQLFSDKEIDSSEHSTKPMSSGVVNEIPSDEDEWRKLEIEEVEIILRHYEVKLEQAKLILQVMKSRAGQ